MMRAFLFLLIVVLVSPLQAVPWRNDAFGVSANLPDTQGWQPVQSGDVPGMTILVSMQNQGRVFGITALNNPPSTNLRDLATQQALETMLKGFGYTWAGASTTSFGGLDWRQYNVTAGTANGVVRYTAGNGHIYAVTLLVSGNSPAAQDLELQTAGGSVRLYAPVAEVASTSPTPSSGIPGTGKPQPASGTDDSPKVDSGSFTTLLITGGAALVFVLVLLLASSRGRKS
jgi:hypothetical protein